MPEIVKTESDAVSDENRLNFDDAWLVAHDLTIKRKIDSASGSRRVARNMIDAIERGHDAMPEIQLKARLAQQALRTHMLYDDWISQTRGFGESVVAKWRLGHNNRQYQMYIDEGDAALRASAGSASRGKNPYFQHDRNRMSPGEIWDAEIAVAAQARRDAEEDEGVIEKRMQTILSTQGLTDRTPAQLEGLPPKDPGDRRWEVYPGDGDVASVARAATDRSMPDELTFEAAPVSQETNQEGEEAAED